MNEPKAKEKTADLILEYKLDASPKKIWRAISMPEFREQWLPNGELADAKPISSVLDKEVVYRMKDNEAPFLESLVTFQIEPNIDGTTTLKIIHALTDSRLMRQQLLAANNNRPRLLMRAA